MEQGQQTTDRKAIIKYAKALAARNPDYKFSSNPSNIYVTDMNREHIAWFDENKLSGRYFQVFCAQNVTNGTGVRTKAQIAAGEPLVYRVKIAEQHYKG